MIAGLPHATELPDRVGVLVLGSGLAGCAALLAAAEAGQYAVMLEKTDEIGGSTVRSAGLSAYAGTDEQAAQGIADSVELLRKDLLETGKHRSDEALVDLYCDHQLDTYRWLKGHGVRYGEVHAASGQSVPRSHPTDTTGMLTGLLKAAGRLGARLVTGTAARRILREDGRVVGVEVDGPAGPHRIDADAVVVATGGFSRSPELLARFAPQLEHALHAGGPGCTGDGMLLAWQLGAGVVDTPYVKGTYGIYHRPHPGEDGTGILAVYKGAIAVNCEGRRFVDESLPYKEIGDAALAQPGVTTWQVFDAQVMAASNDEVPIYEFAGRERAGMLLRGETVAELEAAVGLPEGSLIATVEDYNRRIRDGEPDQLGRRALSSTVGDLLPLDRPPFYAHPSGTVVLATYCGLTVDTTMRVVDVLGEPIERLYAAGEVVGGFHGAGYMTGTSIGKAGIFGRIAGAAAAAEESGLTW
ncbi:FAD-dependent oxidoreductase [Nocardioides sp. zg-579]|uniref:FAD-dependent oxidoreductase n=1 Tax=Nocardioides marmotae TaxID=2663857 RepID=A0A6I3JEK1_9ACTN|nr:FAD-dependent oxidoreductase [Nocardioides marmotae]MCR6032835.1 FAD-dependent oxidoreductase [Gordonia jinghuaiqii]MTB96485.1 FAD-dependent oxidoreductase [Nocardioides marmotae]QKE01992.1 FAD-dependent oxidoreductase [Nocardioides marmotae]